MPSFSGSTILIVGETADVSALRTRLVEAGSTVHVVSVAGRPSWFARSRSTALSSPPIVSGGQLKNLRRKLRTAAVA